MPHSGALVRIPDSVSSANSRALKGTGLSFTPGTEGFEVNIVDHTRCICNPIARKRRSSVMSTTFEMKTFMVRLKQGSGLLYSGPLM